MACCGLLVLLLLLIFSAVLMRLSSGSLAVLLLFPVSDMSKLEPVVVLVTRASASSLNRF